MKEQPEKRLFFGSDNRCLETGLRWSNIGVRTVHIAAASVVFGGVLLGTGFSSLHGWQRWVLASGLVLLALEWLHDRRWPHRGKGLLVQVHILCALAAYLWPLSANADDVRAALDAGFPAARVYPKSQQTAGAHPDEVRIAFDGDAVLFSDEAEQVYHRQGLSAFHDHEVSKADTPLPPGPFKPLLEALHRLRNNAPPNMRIRTALVTARSAPAHERAIRTLMAWRIEVDEALFLGGLEKGPFLREFQPDFFFDDQTGHCDSAATAGPTGHVISGIRNESA